jgi:hypothetical protein
MAVPAFEPLALDLVRQCAAEAGLREIHFSHVSRCVSFLDDAGVRINVYFSTGKTSPGCLLACSLSALAASMPLQCWLSGIGIIHEALAPLFI